MKPGRWQDIERLYHLVQELTQDEREIVLQKECGEDESLRREVESLLVHPSEGHDFFEAPALAVAAMALAKDRLNVPPVDLTGRTIAHYRVLEKIGEGGMGVVSNAFDTHLQRPVAIKVLPPEIVADRERRLRFVQEARAASALNHPNIVHVYDIDQSEGTDFIAMEYVSGKTLGELIPRNGMRLTDVLNYSAQIAAALAEAHAAGIVHRDLKPANVMVAKGLVKVLDFGLAKLIECAEEEKSSKAETHEPRTEEGTVLGTVSYMSPEQAEAKEVDARSDIFSLGSLIYEMVTGRRAFEGGSRLPTLSAILRDDPKPMSGITPATPAGLEKLISRCLRKDPEHRWQTMADLKVALDELKEDPDSGRSPGVVDASPNQQNWLVWAGGIVALIVTVATGAWLRFVSPTSDPRPASRTIPLTSYQGVEDYPSFSPDGNQVAFVWNGPKQDNYDIYVKPVGSENALRLTSDPEADRYPAWSPDGRYVAFLRWVSGSKAGVFLVTALGGPERKLAEAGWGRLSWFPNGKWLAVADQGSIYLLLRATISGSPHWSPDGQTIVFDSNLEGQFELYLVDANGGNPRRITNHPADDALASFSRDGHSIYFSSDRTKDYQIWRMPADGGEPIQVTRNGGRIASESVDGKFVYFSRDVWTTSVWRVPAGGGEETKVLEPALGQALTVVRNGIYFVAEGRDENRIQFLRFATGKLTTLASINRPVRWGLSVSSDERSLLYTQLDQMGSDLMLVENFR